MEHQKGSWPYQQILDQVGEALQVEMLYPIWPLSQWQINQCFKPLTPGIAGQAERKDQDVQEAAGRAGTNSKKKLFFIVFDNIVGSYSQHFIYFLIYERAH